MSSSFRVAYRDLPVEVMLKSKTGKVGEVYSNSPTVAIPLLNSILLEIVLTMR